jgi:hypothetical protein
MSALPSEADIEATTTHVCFGPIGDICSAERPSLFDHLVGAGEERLGHGKAECLRRGQVDDEIELGRLLDRNFGWVCPA